MASLSAVSAVWAVDQVVPAGKTYVKLNAKSKEIARFKSGRTMADQECVQLPCPKGDDKDTVCWRCPDFPKTKAEEQSVASPPVKVEKTKVINLHLAMAQMNEGSNVLYTGARIKLVAAVKDGKVVQWTATDGKGNTLPTTVVQNAVPCTVSVTIETAKGESKSTCFEVDCDKLSGPTTPAEAKPPQQAQ